MVVDEPIKAFTLCDCGAFASDSVKESRTFCSASSMVRATRISVTAPSTNGIRFISTANPVTASSSGMLVRPYTMACIVLGMTWIKIATNTARLVGESSTTLIAKMPVKSVNRRTEGPRSVMV